MTPAPVVIPFLTANPLLGAILPYVPFGTFMHISVCTNALPLTGMTSCWVLLRSYPAARLVPLTGNVAFGDSNLTLSALSCHVFGAGQIQAILGFLLYFPLYPFAFLRFSSRSFALYHAPIAIPSRIFTLSLFTLGISSRILATASFALFPSHLHSLSLSFTSLCIPWLSFLLALPSLYK